MIQIAMNNSLFVVLEPGNVKRMEEGKPLVIGTARWASVGIVVVPDVEWMHGELQKKMPESAEELDQLLAEARKRPKVER